MILVTGGAGFIGSNLVAALAESGQRVVVCDQFGQDEKWRNLAKHDLHEVIAPGDLARWLDHHDSSLSAIFHMGAISSTDERDVDLIARTNIALSLMLWDHARARAVPFLYASSAATYGDGAQGFVDDGSLSGLAKLRPMNAYGWSKLVVDRRIARDVAESQALPPYWAGFKFFNVYGPNEAHKGAQRSVVHQIFGQIRSTGRARLFKSHRHDIADGGQMRDFIHVQDAVAVMLWVHRRRASGLFNLGTGEARSFQDLALATFAAMDLEPAIEFIDTPMDLRGHYQYWTRADMTKLRQAGYSAPFLSLEDGVASYVRDHLLSADPYR